MFLILEERLVSESTGDSLDLNPIQEVSNIMKMNCESYPNNKTKFPRKVPDPRVFCAEKTIVETV